MKRLLPLIIFAVVAYLILSKSPFFKEKFDQAKEKLTTWSEEQIKKDPTGVPERSREEHQEEPSEPQLQQSSIEKIDAELKAHNQKMVDKAEELSTAFKDAYKAAEANGSWPVEVEGASYTKDKLRSPRSKP
ncbi:MAG: hypothetical protein R3F33_14735 [Planctomycetota bacterium]